MEHRLSGKEAPDAYPVEPANETVTLPGLERDGVTPFVQVHVGLDEGRADPALFPTRRRIGTALNDFLKSPVDRETKFAALHVSLQPPRHMKLIKGKDTPSVWRPPGDRALGPWEDAFWIGLEKSFRRQIHGDRHQSIPIREGGIREKITWAEEGCWKLQGLKTGWGALDEGA